jgi:hypothetical protein
MPSYIGSHRDTPILDGTDSRDFRKQKHAVKAFSQYCDKSCSDNGKNTLAKERISWLPQVHDRLQPSRRGKSWRLADAPMFG